MSSEAIEQTVIKVGGIILLILTFLKLYRQDILDLIKPRPKDNDQDKK